jgi:anti-sigma28 factor (negative regulator of flagellin synthesis)
VSQQNQEKTLPVPEQTPERTPEQVVETPEERAKRVADIKHLVSMGRYHVNCQEILYNMLKTAP